MPCLRREVDRCLPSFVDQHGLAVEPYAAVLQPSAEVVVPAVGRFWGGWARGGELSGGGGGVVVVVVGMEGIDIPEVVLGLGLIGRRGRGWR